MNNFPNKIHSRETYMGGVWSHVQLGQVSCFGLPIHPPHNIYFTELGNMSSPKPGDSLPSPSPSSTFGSKIYHACNVLLLHLFACSGRCCLSAEEMFLAMVLGGVVALGSRQTTNDVPNTRGRNKEAILGSLQSLPMRIRDR